MIAMDCKFGAATAADHGVRLHKRQCTLQVGQLELLAAKDGDPKGTRKFSGVAHSGAIMRRETWNGPMNVAVDVASLRFTRQDVPVLRDHDPTLIVGYSTELSKDGTKVRVEGHLVDATEAGREVIALMESGVPMQMSVWVPPAKVRRFAEGEEGEVNGQKIKGPAMVLVGAVVREVTLTALGADEHTGASLLVAQSAGSEGFEYYAEETKNVEPDTMELAAPNAAAVTPAAVQGGGAPAAAATMSTVPSSAPVDAALAERQRAKEIRRLGRGHAPEVVESAIDAGLSVADAAVKFCELADARRADRLEEIRRLHATPVGASGVDRFVEGRQVDPATRLEAMPDGPEKFKAEWSEYGFGGHKPADVQREFRSFEHFAAYRRHPWPAGSPGARFAEMWASNDAYRFGASSVLSPRSVRGTFFKRQEEVTAASWVPVISHMFSSDQASEDYRFLGQSPAMRQWLGNRRVQEPRPYSIVATNGKYEGGVEFSRDDMRRDKTGQIVVRIGDLGARAAQLPQKILTTVLEANANAYDGVAFFGTHVAASVITNALTDSSVADAGAPTSAEFMAGVLRCVQTIMGAKDDQGEPLNEGAMAFAVMVPVGYWQAAIAALGNEFTSAGVSNTLQTMVRGRRVTIELIMNARLTAPATGGTGVFYVFRTDADVKPLIWQDEVEVELDALVDGSDFTFNTDMHRYGAKRIGAGVGAAFEMAARMTFS